MKKNRVKRALFRVDGSRRLGLGHLQRCLVLARELAGRGYDFKFVTRNILAADIIQKSGYTSLFVKNGSEIVEIIGNWCPDIVVVDTPRDQNLPLKITGNRPKELLWFGFDIENNFRSHYDLLTTFYETDHFKHPTLLTGISYVVISPEFKRLKAGYKVGKAVNKIIACFGGSDPQDFSRLALEAFRELDGYEREIILGPGYGLNRFKNLYRSSKGADVRLIRDCPDIGQKLASADIGLFSFGTMAFEASCIGIPSFLVAPSLFHVEIEKELRKKYSLTCWEMLGERRSLSVPKLVKAIRDLDADYRKRQQLSKSGQTLVDGRGAERIRDLIDERVSLGLR